MNRLICSVLLAAFAVVTARAGTLVQFRTLLGDIEVELYDQDKPATVRNFIRYIQAGYYQNVFFHRCVPGFVLQGGGYFTADKGDPNFFTPATLYAWPTYPPISNEFSVGRRFSNTNHTIAMARSAGQTNSATKEFFFNLANNAALDGVDGGFTVFGRVLRGTNVLDFFNGLAYNFGVIDMRGYFPGTFFGDLMKELPVAFFGAAPPFINDLIYVDISLLNVQVKRLAGSAREISWNSVSGKTNRVEFTTDFPPTWQSLAITNGTGLTMKATDASTNAARRFYRVRVDY